jgi:hypothetical protein
VVLTHDWTVLCFDRHLKLLWESNPMKVCPCILILHGTDISAAQAWYPQHKTSQPCLLTGAPTARRRSRLRTRSTRRRRSRSRPRSCAPSTRAWWWWARAWSTRGTTGCTAASRARTRCVPGASALQKGLRGMGVQSPGARAPARADWQRGQDAKGKEGEGGGEKQAQRNRIRCLGCR